MYQFFSPGRNATKDCSMKKESSKCQSYDIMHEDSVCFTKQQQHLRIKSPLASRAVKLSASAYWLWVKTSDEWNSHMRGL